MQVAVKGSPEDFVHDDAAVRGQLEELRLRGVRRPYGDPVTVTHLVQVKHFSQVPDGAFFNVAGAPEPLGATVRKFDRVIRRPQRPRDVVDEATLVPADDFSARSYLQGDSDIFRGFLDLNLDRADGSLPVPLHIR